MTLTVPSPDRKFGVGNARPLPSEIFSPELTAKFWRRVKMGPPDQCWPWVGNVNPKGYGVFSIRLAGIRTCQAHRWVYAWAHGSIDTTLVVDHLCRNKACVNPGHLELVTPVVNTRRGDAGSSPDGFTSRLKKHCVNGHERTESNLYLRSDGARVCRLCLAERNSRYYRSRVSA